jgi:hypothetical protein
LRLLLLLLGRSVGGVLGLVGLVGLVGLGLLGHGGDGGVRILGVGRGGVAIWVAGMVLLNRGIA